MFAQYRYHGKYISAAKASRLANLPTTRDYVTTSIRESKKTAPILESPGMLKGVTLKTVYAMEKDRRTREDQRQRRIDRERERTLEFKRKQATPAPEGIPYSYPEHEPIIERYTPSPEEEAEEVSIPFDPVPYEDQLIDDYFEDIIEVADIDGDIYVEQ